MNNANSLDATNFPPESARLVNRSWFDLLRIAELVPTHTLHNVTPTATGHVVVNDRDLFFLARSLDMEASELRSIINIINQPHWAGRFGAWLLRRYAAFFPPLPGHLQQVQ